MAGVRCPSFRAPINTEGGNTKKKRGRIFENKRTEKTDGMSWKGEFLE